MNDKSFSSISTKLPGQTNTDQLKITHKAPFEPDIEVVLEEAVF